MLYRLLRPGENWLLGLWAKNRTSDVSVFIHVIKGSSREYDSKYISTFGSLNAMLNFRSKSMTPGAQMVQIVEDNLPVIDKIDLRTSGIRSEQYILDHPQYPNALINKFNNYAKKFEEVLLVGHVPPSHIQPVEVASFVPVRLPT
jgi:hypothetical protein